MLAAKTPLPYDDRGTGVPLVFIHGLTFSRRTWDPIVDRIADRYRCITFDLPGHGESSDLPQSMESLLLQVHRSINDLEIDSPVLIGHSFGGMFATIYAAHFRVRGVINVDQPLDALPFIGMLRQMEPGLRGPNFATVFEPIRLRMGIELLPEPIRTATLATQTVRQDLVLAYWRELLVGSPDDICASIDMAAARIEAPYLALFGHQMTNAEREGMQTRLPRAELEEWPDLGHMVHLMNPDRFAARVADFVLSLGVPRELKGEQR